MPKLHQFEAKVKSLPKEDPNYLYIKTVIGVEATADSPRQEGIINRFWKKMQEVVGEEMAKQQLLEKQRRLEEKKQQQQQILAANSQDNPALLTADNLLDRSQDNEEITLVQSDINEIIDAKEVEHQKLETAKRKPLSLEDLEQLERLDNLLDKGRITEAEYQQFKQDLFGN